MAGVAGSHHSRPGRQPTTVTFITPLRAHPRPEDDPAVSSVQAELPSLAVRDGASLGGPDRDHPTPSTPERLVACMTGAPARRPPGQIVVSGVARHFVPGACDGYIAPFGHAVAG